MIHLKYNCFGKILKTKIICSYLFFVCKKGEDGVRGNIRHSTIVGVVSTGMLATILVMGLNSTTTSLAKTMQFSVKNTEESLLTSVIDEQEDSSVDSEFITLMKINNITVVGSVDEFTHFQLDGLIDEVQPDAYEVIQRYTNLSDTTDGMITISEYDLLELIFYSYTEAERTSFLTRVQNEKVDRMFRDGAILIGYN